MTSIEDMAHKQIANPLTSSPASAASARLYALHIKLRPLQQGTLMPFNGELVHGAFLNWLRTIEPDIATWLHQGNGRRHFTCSSLQWPLSAQRMLEAERENTHMPLDPQKLYTVRLTLLQGELFPLFYQALTDFSIRHNEEGKPPFMRIGKQVFLLEEVIVADDDPSGWTGFSSLAQLVEKAATRKMGKAERLTLEFASLTTFTRGGNKEGEYGNFHAMLPLPQYVFPVLARRWQEIAPPEFTNMVQKERIDQYTQNDGAVIVDYTLRPHHVHFTTHVQPGFIGTCTYLLRGPDAATTAEVPLTVRQQMLLLAQLGFYSGLGYKTSMGMGRIRMI